MSSKRKLAEDAPHPSEAEDATENSKNGLVDLLLRLQEKYVKEMNLQIADIVELRKTCESLSALPFRLAQGKFPEEYLTNAFGLENTTSNTLMELTDAAALYDVPVPFKACYNAQKTNRDCILWHKVGKTDSLPNSETFVNDSQLSTWLSCPPRELCPKDAYPHQPKWSTQWESEQIFEESFNAATSAQGSPHERIPGAQSKEERLRKLQSGCWGR